MVLQLSSRAGEERRHDGHDVDDGEVRGGKRRGGEGNPNPNPNALLFPHLLYLSGPPNPPQEHNLTGYLVDRISRNVTKVQRGRNLVQGLGGGRGNWELGLPLLTCAKGREN